MGIRCFIPVSDGHKKTETVHSLLFSQCYFTTLLTQVNINKVPTKPFNGGEKKNNYDRVSIPDYVMLTLYV